MAKNRKDKKEKKGGLLGRLFGGAKADDQGDEAPPPAGGGEELTIAPGYAPAGGEADLTMAPGYAHTAPEKSGEIGHVSFGTGRFPRPADGAPPTAPPTGPPTGPPADPFGGLEAAGRTIAPDYADDDDLGAGELTMAPGYAGPELTAPRRPADPFADPFADMAPPAAAAKQPVDPFADAFGDVGAGELTMAPGYAGSDLAAPGKKPGKLAQADPFADAFGDLGAGELTMAPGYAGGDLAAPGKKPGKPAQADPFADPFGDLGAGELTMAPGYAGGDLAAPGKKPGKPAQADPFADAFGDLDAGELTMAPGYAGGDLTAPGKKSGPSGGMGAGELTTAPGYAGGPGAGPAGRSRPGEPFVELDPGDLTMAPGYAGGPPPRKGAAVDPFAELEAAAKPTEMDPFEIDMDLGPDPIGGAAAPVIPEDAFTFEPAAAPSPARAVVGPSGDEPFDPFGPALLDDPFAQAPSGPTAPTAPTAPTGSTGPTAPTGVSADPDQDDDFRGERTMVDLTTDVDMLATLESTDELTALETPDAVALEGALELGEAVAPLLTATPPLAAAPARPAPPPRPLFQAARPDAGGTRHAGAAADVVLDATRGLVFAPRAAGGWTGVPAGFEVLSDGSVVGRGRVEGRDVVVAASPPAAASDGERRLAPFPPEVKVDRVTRAVLWPAALEERLSWRPARVARLETGLAFTLPPGTRFEDDGAVVVPADTTTTGAQTAARDPAHGRVTARFAYLGIVEEVHEDGWARLTLPPGASIEAGRLIVPAARAAGAPPLLRPERLADGHLALPLPAGAQAVGDALWVPPSAAPAADLGEPWADRDARVLETREYAGVREELLDDGWLRLELPEGARVEPARGARAAARVVVPPEYARLGAPAALLELERLPCGSLAFELPPAAECLGWRVLVPPADHAPPVSTPPVSTPPVSTSRVSTPARAERREDEPSSTEVGPAEQQAAVESPLPDKDPDPPSRKMKALDRFRRDKRPQNDTITFDGVLRSESIPSGGVVSPDVPAARAVEPTSRIDVQAPIEAPVAAAVAAPSIEAGAEAEAGTGGGAEAGAEAGAGAAGDDAPADLASAATGAFSPGGADDAPSELQPAPEATEAEATEAEATEAEATEPEATEPELQPAPEATETELTETELTESGDGSVEGEATESGEGALEPDAAGDDASKRKSNRRRRKKGKRGDEGGAP